jgi:type IV pilus assembly protein PilY1
MNTQKITLSCLLTLIFLTGLYLPAVQAESPDYADSCYYAGQIALNSTTNGYITKGYNCRWYYGHWTCYSYPDRDHFKIVVPEAGTLSIYTTNPAYNPILDTAGSLYDSSSCNYWDILAENDDVDPPSNMNFSIVQEVSPGTYWLGVEGGHWDMQGSYTLHVDFTGVHEHTITASAGAGGSISPAGDVGAAQGDVMTFTITPDACYDVADVEVDGVSVGATTSYTFTNISGDHSIAASFFVSESFTINVLSDGNGYISDDDALFTQSTGAATVDCGSDKAIDITALSDYKILDVKVDGVSVVDPLTVGSMTTYTFSDVQAGHTLTASFTKISNFIITTVAGDNGSIVPPGPVGVEPAGSLTFSIGADPGYDVAEVWVDATSVGMVDTYTFANVTANHELRAEFDLMAPRPDLDTCIDISDVPMDTRVRSAPASIMFVLDDSGSMDWEFMTGEDEGQFEGERYIFNNPGDNLYSDSYILDSSQRKKWKSQWFRYNMLYYNPRTEYTPWPNKSDADTTTPWSHPHVTAAGSPSLNLTAEFTQFSAYNETIVVDDKDAEFSIISGDWNTGGFHADAYDSDFTESTLEDVDMIARWSPNLIAGNYDVFARWVADTAYDSTTVYYVVPDGVAPGTAIVVDQTADGGTFGDETTANYLGNFAFTPAGYVEIYEDKSKKKQVSADAVKFVPTGSVTASIKNAHYYTWYDANEDGELDSAETVYLVSFVDTTGDGALDTRRWFEFADDGDDVVEAGELTEVSETGVPEIVRPHIAADDLQNFANWYSYYRRRELSATAAIATVISNVSGMQIGIYSINQNLKVPVHKIHVGGVDETATLLDTLYNLHVSAEATPLRQGLQNVGRYFHKDDNSNGGIGSSADPDDDSPFADAADGGECQQCFAIVMTDGFWNGSSPGVGNTDADDANSDFDGPPYADTYSDTLADVAMKYYETDLVPDLNDFVPANNRDKARHQHMVTYGIGFGVAGSLTLAEDYLETGIYPTWTNPADGNDAHKIDDLLHAAVNGRGGYLKAQNSLELINDLYVILKDIALFSGSASSVSVNGDELYTRVNDNVMLFQSKYYSETWHGDVLAYRVDSTTGELIEPALWSAAKSMSLQSLAGRKIATFDGSSAGIPFRFDNLTIFQKALLDPAWETDDTAARNILDYVRGDPSLEIDNGGTFRNRTWKIADQDHPYNGSIIASSRLGDIVHSSPVYRNGVLYSGGNDGMLHALDAETGREIFAYVPNLVIANLPNLTDPVIGHQFFVDLTPKIADVDLSGVTTMLVGGLGKGGRGYYALNLTDVSTSGVVYPLDENDLARMVMWEFPNWSTSNTVVADLGYSYSKPEILKTYDANYPYIVIFGNGYNSPNGRAVLFILNPATGELIKRIDTGVGTCNGLSTPVVVDVDYDDKVDYVYAGDLKGNMWKFDLTSDDSANWDVAYYESGTPMPLFKAVGQPITTRPDVMYHCEKDGYLVLFGTGKYLEDWDLSDTSSQAVYGIWDYGDDADDGEYVGTISNGTFTSSPQLPSGTTSVLAQSVADVQTANDLDLRTLSDSQADWTTSTLNPADGTACGDYGGTEDCDPNGTGTGPDPVRNVGWYFTLPDAGERVVSDVIAREGNLIVVSYAPGGSMCATGGHTWVMALDACSGGRLSEANFDINGDGAINDQDLVDIGTSSEILAPPTGIQYTGRLQPPAILIQSKSTETLYMSSSIGKIERLGQKAARLGVYYWNIFSQ